MSKMYDELVKRLRDDEAWKNCDFDFIYGWMHESADAIEELAALSRRQEVKLVELTGELASKLCWIPVTERLPEEDGCYLVAVKNDHKRRYSKTAWFSYDSWFTRQDVTHWMPLPQPPEEE